VDTVIGQSEQTTMSQGMTEVTFFKTRVDFFVQGKLGAVTFLVKIKNYIEAPNRLVLEVSACGYSEYLGDTWVQ